MHTTDAAVVRTFEDGSKIEVAKSDLAFFFVVFVVVGVPPFLLEFERFERPK